MTPPRRNTGGAPQRGQVAAVMLRALAAELSDPARFRRAVAYARDGAVLDIDITAGVVRVLVRGSRFEPYQAHVWVDPVDADVQGLALVPRRDEVVADCTCPDDSPSPGAFCKHALAALLVLADEVAIDPEVLDHLARRHRRRRRTAVTNRPPVDRRRVGTRRGWRSRRAGRRVGDVDHAAPASARAAPGAEPPAGRHGASR